MNYKKNIADVTSILVMLMIFGKSSAFHIGSAKTFSLCRLNAVGEEPDLFDYFDPLLSPHSYPNGISPNSKPIPDASGKYGAEQSEIRKSDNDQLIAKEKDQTVAANNDFFDPLLSPHMYPNGTPDRVIEDISAGLTNSLVQPEALEASVSTETNHQADLLSLLSAESKNAALEENCSLEEPNPDYFDPTISPHCYPNGTPDNFAGEKENTNKKRVGVLLIDHGSRNEASNERLRELARLYQSYSSNGGKHVMVVQAAHMEIANPSIPEGLKTLLDQQVDEIICHPYFLSANGRHVSEDIPTIINDAMVSLDISIPVVTTEPVGSLTEMMMGAIESLVQKSSAILSENN